MGPGLIMIMRTSARAVGHFLVDFEPLPSNDEFISRMRVTRTYSGGLAGRSTAQMLSVGTAMEGSCGYVLIELVSGVLDGRRGDFVLEHAGVMWRGETSLAVTVVPDSGTDELLGLRGKVTIENLGSTHSYIFEYELEPL